MDAVSNAEEAARGRDDPEVVGEGDLGGPAPDVIVNGTNGTYTMLFNGANGAEQVDLSANGNRLRFFRG